MSLEWLSSLNAVDQIVREIERRFSTFGSAQSHYSVELKMGNAKFYFYPEPNGGRLVEIDLGERLGELFF